MLGDQDVLQITSDIPFLLANGGGDREQAVVADRTLTGLDATPVALEIPDLALNHRLAYGTTSGIVGGFDVFDFQNSPVTIGHWQQLMAGFDRFSPRRLLAALKSLGQVVL